MPEAKQAYPKRSRLRSRAQYLAMARARRLHTEHFLFLWRPNGLAWTRLGVTVTRRIAGAVGRNRVKRLVREAFRLAGGSVPGGVDLVAVAHRGSPGLSRQEVSAELALALARLPREPAGPAGPPAA